MYEERLSAIGYSIYIESVVENCVLKEERNWSKSPKSNSWQYTILVCISC